MIWYLIFLLTPSGGIAASNYPVRLDDQESEYIYMDVPEFAFEGDIVKISCSRNISDADTKFLFLNLYIKGIAVARSFENARPKVLYKDITVMPGSNATHLSVTMKAQCKYAYEWRCMTPGFNSKTYNNFDLRVLKNVTALQLFASNDVCARGDQNSNKVCQTCEKVVPQTGKKYTVKCQADVSTKASGVYRFDWDITAKGIAVNGDWTTIPRKSYYVDGNASKHIYIPYWQKGACLPLKKVSSSVQIPVQTNVTFVVKCVLTFIVGNLSRTAMATTKLCIKSDSDIAKLGLYTAESKKRDYNKTVFLFLILASLVVGFIIVGVCFIKRRKTAQKTEDNGSESDAQYGQNNTSEIQAELIESKESYSGSKRSLSRSKRSLSHSKRSLSHSKRTYSNPKRS